LGVDPDFVALQEDAGQAKERTTKLVDVGRKQREQQQESGHGSKDKD
jgi:hypothetical protein